MYKIVEHFRDNKPLIKEFEQQLAAYMYFVTRANKAKDFFSSLGEVKFTYMCVDLPRRTLWSRAVLPGERECCWYLEFEFYPEKATDLEILEDLKMERWELDLLAGQILGSKLMLHDSSLDATLSIIAEVVPEFYDQMKCFEYVLVSATRHMKKIGIQ